jgi:hypothetical protein
LLLFILTFGCWSFVVVGVVVAVVAAVVVVAVVVVCCVYICFLFVLLLLLLIGFFIVLTIKIIRICCFDYDYSTLLYIHHYTPHTLGLATPKKTPS